ncbi:MAG TPA: gluconeogenesis factor YvcK family protein [Vicinamibacterales bacterium]|nr:gluconeogenesis factor YvcK family protein [Vicinamibacterales bacterium]
MLPATRPLSDVSRQATSLTGAAPRIVAIGGGTGLPNVLRGLRPLLYGTDTAEGTPPRDRLVAIVATSDDGGSSGRLRAEFNVVPPGDIRNCLAALSDNHALIADIFQYRFDTGEGLNGHPIGNLVLTALADVTNDFARAVEIAARVVGARGTVLPATRDMVTLVAEFDDGRIVSGETAISAGGGRIRQLSLLPERPRCLPDSCEALLKADVIVVGPGSLYTSLLPPLLVPELRDAMHRTQATRIFVANLMTEPGETDDCSALDEVLVLERHLGAQLFDCLVYNTGPMPPPLVEAYGARGAKPVVTGPFELAALERLGIRPIGVPLASEHPAGKIRHHPDRLAAAIVAIAHGKLGAWRGRVEAGGI